MWPDPLHAAVVHFPIVFAVLLPLVATIGAIAIFRGGRVLPWWGATVVLLAALAASSFVAVRTGEREEDRVERVVAEQPLETHEEAGERFLVLAGAMLLLGLGGFLPRRLGTVFRALGIAGTLVLFGAGWQVGHTGGELVYRHGAASAYAASNPDGALTLRAAQERDHD